LLDEKRFSFQKWCFFNHWFNYGLWSQRITKTISIKKNSFLWFSHKIFTNIIKWIFSFHDQFIDNFSLIDKHFFAYSNSISKSWNKLFFIFFVEEKRWKEIINHVSTTLIRWILWEKNFLCIFRVNRIKKNHNLYLIYFPQGITQTCKKTKRKLNYNVKMLI
jgi:hypothetical protein